MGYWVTYNYKYAVHLNENYIRPRRPWAKIVSLLYLSFEIHLPDESMNHGCITSSNGDLEKVIKQNNQP